MCAALAVLKNLVKSICGNSCRWTASTSTCCPARPLPSSFTEPPASTGWRHQKSHPISITFGPVFRIIILSLSSSKLHLEMWSLTLSSPPASSFRAYPSIFTKTFLDFNFSAAPLNSEPSTFVLMFHNPGPITVDW